MTREEAIEIREKQLNGHIVPRMLLIDAIEIIKESNFRRMEKEAKAEKILMTREQKAAYQKNYRLNNKLLKDKIS